MKILKLILALSMCFSACKAQRLMDTAKVVLLITDTSHIYSEYMEGKSCEDVGCKDTTHKNVWHYKESKQDIGYVNNRSTWVFAYSVREKHNTDEGQIDPYHAIGYVSRDYWVHLFYLDENKRPLKKEIIVWNSLPAQ